MTGARETVLMVGTSAARVGSIVRVARNVGRYEIREIRHDGRLTWVRVADEKGVVRTCVASDVKEVLAWPAP